MDYSRLEANIINIVKEEHAKLGYRSEAIRLYYPLQSLNRFLGTDYDAFNMQKELELFAKSLQEKWGRIDISHQQERFCLLLSPQVGDYVKEHTDPTEFIYEFVRAISKHGVTMNELLEVFFKHSEHVHVEKATHGEFDYLVYFEDGIPDEFRYCITDEGHHMIYHRFMADDYDDFGL